jgi:glycosyltransferase involved in cell wall biosynthesis
MVGDGPLSQTVDYQIERIGLKNIRRHRFYRPISDILAITDVLVLPSEYEGMPLIVSETLGMGKPVVVTDVGNNRYVVELTGGGYIVSKIGDISELEAGLRQVFASPPDGKLLRQIIQENFSVEVISNRYLDVLLGKNHER